MTDDRSVSFEERADVTIARLHGSEFCSKTVELIQEKLQQLAEAGKPPHFVLDLSNLSFLNSIGIGAMVVCLKHVKQRGGQLVLVGLKGHCLGILRVVGLTKAFSTCPDIESGIEAIHRKQMAPAATGM